MPKDVLSEFGWKVRKALIVIKTLAERAILIAERLKSPASKLNVVSLRLSVAQNFHFADTPTKFVGKYMQVIERLKLEVVPSILL